MRSDYKSIKELDDIVLCTHGNLVRVSGIPRGFAPIKDVDRMVYGFLQHGHYRLNVMGLHIPDANKKPFSIEPLIISLAAASEQDLVVTMYGEYQVRTESRAIPGLLLAKVMTPEEEFLFSQMWNKAETLDGAKSRFG